MPSLETNYLGLELKSPLVAGSCPLTSDPKAAAALAEAGVGALVVRSIFEEEIRAEMAAAYDDLADAGSAAALDYLRADLPMQLGPERYIEELKGLRKGLKIPVIASINCSTSDQWVKFARKIEAAGADALELNVYDIPSIPDLDSASIEQRHTALVAAVKAEISIPLVVKLSPYYTGLAHFAQRLDRLGVGGLVLFNRFLEPDIDIEKLELIHKGHRSTSEDMHLPLRWVAILRQQVECDLVLGCGVHEAATMIKGLLAGANAIYACTALYKQPTGAVVREMLAGVRDWMQRHDYATLAAFQGAIREEILGDGQGFERSQYVKLLQG